MNSHTFILCAGEASRFPYGLTKQLMTIEGVSILARTIRQLKTCRHWQGRIFVVTHRPDIACEAGKEGAEVIEPEDRRYTCASALSTRDAWTEETKILMGDVFWTSDALDQFMSPHHSTLVYATDGTDIFGMKWVREENGFVADAFRAVIDEGQPRYGGRLHASRKYLPAAYYLRIADRTQDFDTLEEYTNFLKGRGKRRMFVPLRRRCIAKG